MPGKLIVQADLDFANSAPQNTAKDLDVPSQSDPAGQEYEIVVTNPSAVTALTVHVKTKEATGGTWSADHWPELTTFAVPVSTPEGKAFRVQGWNLAQPGRVTVTNDTVLGGANAFTAEIRVRKL